MNNLDRKECSLDKKTQVLKMLKKSKFSKEDSVCRFCQKMIIFLIDISLANPFRNDRFLDILDKKECILEKKSQVIKKSKRSKFSKKGCLENGHFSHRCFLGKSSQEWSVFDTMNRKECFLGKKSQVLKKFKKSKFSHGVTPLFFLKNGQFYPSCLFLFWAKKKPENIVGWYSL